MAFRRRVTAALAVLSILLASAGNGSGALTWDFWPSADLQGWSLLNGYTHFRSNDGGGVTPGNTSNGFAQDSGHATFLIESPQFWFDGSTLDGTNVMTWGSGGGAGDQNNAGMQFADPAAVLAYNGGNSNSTGQKGLAFLNTSTGSYDAVLFNQGNGGTDNYSLTAANLTAAGLDLGQSYRLHYYENDDGGWGWGQFNYANVAAGLSPPSAGTLTWDGAANGNWSDASWVGANPPPPPAYPDATIVAEIGPMGTNNTVTVDGNYAAHTVNLSGNGQLAVGAGNTLEVTNEVNAAGNTVNLEAGSTLRTLYGGGSIRQVGTAGQATIDNVAVIDASHLVMQSGSTLVKDGDGTLRFSQSAGSNVTDATNTVRVNGGELDMQSASNPIAGAGLVLDGGTFTVRGPHSYVYNEIEWARYNGADNATYLSGIDDGAANGRNGGLFTLSPTSSGIWTSQTNYDPGDDHYAFMWTGNFHAPTTGSYDFYTHGDDYEILFIDLNQNGEFDGAAERVTANLPPESWNTPKTGTVSLTGGEAYAFAAAGYEGAGGEFFDFKLQEPGGTLKFGNPSDAAQANWWSRTEYGAVDMSDSDVTVMSDSTLNAVTQSTAAFGNVTFQDGVLTVQGAPGGMSFTGASVTGSGTVGLNTQTDTMVGPLDGAGNAATFVKTGPADLTFNGAGTNLAGTTLDVQQGRLVAVGASGPLGEATLKLSGGEALLSSTGGDVAYNNDVQVTVHSNLTAGQAPGGAAGPLTLTLGSPGKTLSIDSGKTLTLGATDGYSLDVAGQVAGGNVKINQGSVALSGGGTVDNLDVPAGTASTSGLTVGNQLTLGGETTFRISSGDSFDVAGADLGDNASQRTLTLSGGTLTVQAQSFQFNELNYGFYDNAAASNLPGIDDGADNDANGGLFSLTPTTSSTWTGEVWQGGDMSDTYCQMWWGNFHAPQTGTYTFYVHGDDYEILWIDTDQDIDFETGVDDVSRNVEGEEGWNTPHTETVDLVAGSIYPFALAHREGNGGDFVNVTITTPGGSAQRINPSNPAQNNWWSSGAVPQAIVMPGTHLEVTADSTLSLDSAGPATLGNVTLGTPGSPATLTLAGSAPGLTVGNLTGTDGSTVDASALPGGLGFSGTLAPGSSLGTLNVTGDLAVGDGAVYEWEVGSAGNDLTNVTGELSFLGNWTLQIVDLGFDGIVDPGQEFVLFDYGTGVGPFDQPTFDVVSSDNRWITSGLSVKDTGSTLVLTGLSVVPEPTSLALCGLALAVLAGCTRRRRRRTSRA